MLFIYRQDRATILNSCHVAKIFLLSLLYLRYINLFFLFPLQIVSNGQYSKNLSKQLFYTKAFLRNMSSIWCNIRHAEHISLYFRFNFIYFRFNMKERETSVNLPNFKRD